MLLDCFPPRPSASWLKATAPAMTTEGFLERRARSRPQDPKLRTTRPAAARSCPARAGSWRARQAEGSGRFFWLMLPFIWATDSYSFSSIQLLHRRQDFRQLVRAVLQQTGRQVHDIGAGQQQFQRLRPGCGRRRWPRASGGCGRAGWRSSGCAASASSGVDRCSWSVMRSSSRSMSGW